MMIRKGLVPFAEHELFKEDAMALLRSTTLLSRSRLWITVVGFMALGLGVPELPLLSADEPQKPAVNAGAPALPVERLLPARTVFLWVDEGFVAHQAGWDKTAASDSLTKTGVFQIGQTFVDSYVSLLDIGGAETVELKQTIKDVVQSLQIISDHGYVIAVSLPDGKGVIWPRLTVVLPRGASIGKTLVKLSVAKVVSEVPPASIIDDEEEEKEAPCQAQPQKEEQNDPPQSKEPAAAPAAKPDQESFWKPEKLGARDIYRAGDETMKMTFPGLDFAFWDEQGDFVFVWGFDAVNTTLAVLDQKSPSITGHRIWKELHAGARGFERRSYGWVDVKELRAAYDDLPVSVDGFGWQALEGLGSTIESLLELAISPLEMLFGAVLDTPGVVTACMTEVAAVRAQVDMPVSGNCESLLVAKTDDVIGQTAELDSETALLSIGSECGEDVPDPVEKGATPDVVAAPKVEAATPSVTLKQLVTLLGMESVQHYTWQSGYKGRALWSEAFLSISGPRRGVLAFVDQPQIQFAQLPPLPVDTVAFSASSFDLKAFEGSATQLLKSVGTGLAGVPADQIEQGIREWRNQHGPVFDEVVGGLDPLVCVYNDRTNGPLTIGPVLVWKVKDAVQLRRGLDKLVSLLTTPSPNQEVKNPDQGAAIPVPPDQIIPPGDLKPGLVANVAPEQVEENVPPPVAANVVVVEAATIVVKKTRLGRELVGLQMGGYPFGIVFTVDENWLVVSLNSQMVEAFLLRVDGKLPHWEPSAAHQDAVRDLPDRFTSISVDDPRVSLPSTISLGYCGLSWIETMFRTTGTTPQLKTLLDDVPNLPPAELVVLPLFPNVSVTTVDPDGMHWYARSSLPSFSFVNYAAGYYLVAAFGGEFLSF